MSMEEQNATDKKTITTWQDLVEKMAKPARFPKFPELTSNGEWKPWSAEPESPHYKTSTIKQPTKVPSRFRRLISTDKRFCRPLRYKPLPEGHVRLLDLSDARMESDVLVEFKLITVPLSAAPQYEAISYCWGNTDLCTGIFVSTRFHGTQIYRVTENLATCLHSLIVSHPPGGVKSRYIWVDQVCINQEELDERNAQVRRMAEIYKTAASVIVWLGQKSDFKLKDHVLELHPDSGSQWRGRSILAWAQDWQVFARPWFQRLWVFQEAVFAQRIYILTGPAWSSWEQLRESEKSYADFDQEDSSFEYLLILTRAMHMVEAIDETKVAMSQNGYADLPTLMWKLDENLCQNPRDKVFSLVGFAGDILPADFVDYKQSTAAISQSYTRHTINYLCDLEIITYQNPGSSERRPSWVPHWSEHLAVGIMCQSGLPSASRGRVWKKVSDLEGDELVVSGKIVDTLVTEVHSFKNRLVNFLLKRASGSILREPFLDAWSHVRHINEAVDEPSCSEQTSSKTKPEEAALESLEESSSAAGFFTDFFRTLFPAGVMAEEDYKILIQPNDENKASERLSELVDWGLHRDGQLFVLESGRLGFVTESGRGPKAGDSIAILHGLKVPCILQKAEDVEGYLYVTDMYIHDMMHGEAVDWEEDEADAFTLV